MKAGERQIAPTLEGVRADHVGRYRWALSRVEGKRVLDCACGVGYGSWLLGEAAECVKGVDIDAEAIAYARAYYARENVTYSVGDATRLGSQTPPFDIVASFETLEHLERPDSALRGFARLAPWLLASVPNQAVLPMDPRRFPHHWRHYTPEEFSGLLSDAGWRVTAWFAQPYRKREDVVEGVDGRTIVVEAVRA